MRKIGLYSALALVFVRCSQIPELLTYQINSNLNVLYIVSLPVLLALVFSKGLQQAFRFWPAFYWLGFTLWITVCIPFSVWQGGSFQLVVDYWRTNLLLLIALGGLVRNWEECRMLFRVLALSCLSNVIIIHLFGQIDDRGRMSLQFGAIANSNDYAAHLIMLLPSALWVALVEKTLLVRVVALGTCAYGTYLILASGSRGALLALAVAVIYFLFSLSGKQRVWAIVLMSVVLPATFGMLSGQVVQRIFSFSDSSSSSASSKEALESSKIRSQLLSDGISAAIQNPLFGLGPDGFRMAEFRAKRGWLPAHNSYLTVATECGVPAFLLFIAGIVSAFRIFQRVGRVEAPLDRESMEMVQAGRCMRLTMLAFCTAVGFINFSYSMHLPIILGIAIAVAHAERNLELSTVGSNHIHSNQPILSWAD